MPHSSSARVYGLTEKHAGYSVTGRSPAHAITSSSSTPCLIVQLHTMSAMIVSGGGWDDGGMTVTLLGAAEIRSLAARLDVTPTKKLGQNFVVDANTVRRIVQVARVGGADRVVEVGPGLGSLTLAILETGATVTAVEIDHRLAAE